MKKVYGLVLAALFGMGMIAQAETQPPVFHGKLTISDNAGAFSEAGTKKAKDAFNDTTFKAKTTWYIHTVSQIPDNKKAEFDVAKKADATRHEFFRNWVKEIANDRGNPSITTLIYTTDKNYYVETHTDKAADVRRDFTSADVKIMDDKIRAVFSKTLKDKIVGSAAHADHDSGLDSATDYVINHLKDTTVSNPNGKNLSDSPSADKKSFPLMGWICGGIIVILLIWLVIGVIRALTGGGGGGGGGYGGGGGGGGGGFMTGLMGGMFGAMAGMWMYNNFFGGHHSSDYGSSNDGYGGGGNDNYGNDNTGEGDYSGGAEDGGGGGDWGDSGGGGDTGGGGDWGGGGGDAGGGGDFGGGGGDW